jgi:hypothetical protein
MNTTPKNCRFLAFINGSDVKITLEPGQSVDHWQGGPDEEGWHSCRESWELSEDGAELRREIFNCGADCDGRHENYQTAIASTDPATFHAGYDPYKNRPAMFPYWCEEIAEQRDQFAELAGY